MVIWIIINKIDRVHELADNKNVPTLDEEGCPVFEIDVGEQLPAVENDDEEQQAEAEVQQKTHNVTIEVDTIMMMTLEMIKILR